MVITSKDNDTIKFLKKLKDKKYRDQENAYIIEGAKLIKEAIQESIKIKMIILCDGCSAENAIDSDLMYEIAKYECICVSEKIFLSLTNVVNPQGILAVVEKNNNTNEIDYNDDLFLILDDLQDPGNMGTILRTADSINLKQIIVSKGSADVYNPKVVRSTMGAIFRIKVIESDDLSKTIKEMKKHKIKVVATSLQTDKSIYDISYEKTAIVIGNEANGVSERVFETVDEKVKIPMAGKTESLNASVATAIVLYEAVRQKMEK